ncbi:alpha/beta hydrolase [Polaromonas sp.]|uniref:alpha/beta hydrolase n=1 Tax=Polaromonas sp. TaxID=1869339 RepID=UPI003BAC5609
MSEANLWRGYDQAALDRQYNSRGTVPDVTVYLREYAERTVQAKAALACTENIAYGPDADERLDIYPATGGNAPVMVFLHGGDWRALSKEDSGFAAPAFVQAGAMFVALDFSLVPATTLPAMGAQVRRALHWLWQNVAAHGGDPQRIHIAGHSSGANLVGQLLMTDWQREFNAPADLVKSAAFMSGLGDLEPVRLSFRNEKLGLTSEVVAEVSLLRRGAVANCPLLVAVGGNETEDYLRQSREVADWWAAQGKHAEFFALAGRHHFDAVLEWAEPASALFKAQCALMGLKPGFNVHL